MSEELTQTTDTISYLIAQIGKTHRNCVNNALATYNLYAGQEMLLMRLWQGDGIAQSELVECMCVQPATITRTLARMERAGLIVRRADPEDQRISRVFLTQEGRELEQQVLALWQQVEQTMVANFTQEERLLLRRLLLQLYTNLIKAG
jgi:MarR family transcriptional regulator, organic hydroperoxide resistance regulator